MQEGQIKEDPRLTKFNNFLTALTISGTLSYFIAIYTIPAFGRFWGVVATIALPLLVIKKYLMPFVSRELVAWLLDLLWYAGFGFFAYTAYEEHNYFLCAFWIYICERNYWSNLLKEIASSKTKS